ncbi:MAG: hypothetical protein K6U80_11705 [Firmicutes bacterium]|nr:hypothetical protein [Bacillota bacterium]
MDNAYAVLLYGAEDDEIQEYFIEKAFPVQKEMDQAVRTGADSEKGRIQHRRRGMKNC